MLFVCLLDCLFAWLSVCPAFFPYSLAQENAKVGVNTYPQHALHFYFNFGPTDLSSVKCINDHSCLPLGGQSVWASYGDVRNTSDTRVCN